jgi:hypothetical protein
VFGVGEYERLMSKRKSKSVSWSGNLVQGLGLRVEGRACILDGAVLRVQGLGASGRTYALDGGRFSNLGRGLSVYGSRGLAKFLA